MVKMVRTWANQSVRAKTRDPPTAWGCEVLYPRVSRTTYVGIVYQYQVLRTIRGFTNGRCVHFNFAEVSENNC